MTLREKLIHHANSGNPWAFRLLVMAVPDPLPPAVLRGWRDMEIRCLAVDMCRWLGDAATQRQIALKLAAAGDWIEIGFKTLTVCPECLPLGRAEKQELAARISRILDLAPGKWPARRQIERIIFECVTKQD